MFLRAASPARGAPSGVSLERQTVDLRSTYRSVGSVPFLMFSRTTISAPDGKNAMASLVDESTLELAEPRPRHRVLSQHVLVTLRELQRGVLVSRRTTPGLRSMSVP